MVDKAKRFTSRNVVQNCTFVAEAAKLDEHTTSAVHAIAQAAQANAEAIAELAKALRPERGGGHMDTALRIGGDGE